MAINTKPQPLHASSQSSSSAVIVPCNFCHGVDTNKSGSCCESGSTVPVRYKDYYKKKGLKCKNPLPFVGGSGPSIFNFIDPMKFRNTFCNTYSDRMFGFQILMKPRICVKDLELLRQK
ncbi:hypothetical protein RUM44_006062 [Polyplax serrata]|uniref:Uncharacterized protein n=1 Tax=Polyplax serrata TaxID=468196 RepID=A0ABR1AYY6_POLSC